MAGRNKNVIRVGIEKLLSDGKPHSLGEIVTAVGHLIPNEVAARYYMEVRDEYRAGREARPLLEKQLRGRQGMIAHRLGQLKACKVLDCDGKRGLEKGYWLCGGVIGGGDGDISQRLEDLSSQVAALIEEIREIKCLLMEPKECVLS